MNCGKLIEFEAPQVMELARALCKGNGLQVVEVELHFSGYCAQCRWEGVTMYLTAQAVDTTLAFIREQAASDSRVVFDYIYASVLRKEHRFYGEREAFETVAKVGESWTFGLEEGAIEPFLADRGFELLTHHTPVDLEKAYLTAKDGSHYGRVNGTHCICMAAVK